MPLHRSTHVIGITAITAAVAVVALAVVGPPKKKQPSLRSSAAVLTCSYREGGALPDVKCTPGAINHAVTQRTIKRTICVKGWTATIRPPENVTEPEKLVSMRQYGFAFGTSPRGYEFDHLIPLELGGAPNDTRNLWPEPHSVTGGKGSFSKDGVENALRGAVCSGTITLAAARREIRTDWTKVTTP